MKALALLTASAIALAACSGGDEKAPARQPISEITVDTDLTSIRNAQAVNYWSRLSDDLQTALATQFVGDISPSGAVLNVDVDELSLANAYSSQFGQNSTLSGQVTLTDQRGQRLSSYTVTATSNQALAGTTGSGNTITPGSSDFYAGLIRAFAAGVDQTINGAAPGS